MISIIDYGMGNLRSVQKGFERVGVAAHIVNTPGDIADAGHLVLPGVGAFRDAIAELQRLDFVSPIIDHVAAGKPLLGICLGMQLLFDESEEGGLFKGLGIIPGRVVRFPDQPGFKVPHMGWNQVRPVGDASLFQDSPADAYFYFVHSYYVAPTDPADIATTTDYIIPFASSIARDNVVATQFHPEKSQQDGLRLLANFANRNAVEVS